MTGADLKEVSHSAREFRGWVRAVDGFDPMDASQVLITKSPSVASRQPPLASATLQHMMRKRSKNKNFDFIQTIISFSWAKPPFLGRNRDETPT
jgi:hypothetical protein